MSCSSTWSRSGCWSVQCRGTQARAGLALADEERKLADYGKRLYGFLLGDGARFGSSSNSTTTTGVSARADIGAYRDAAVLWRPPWEYLCDDAGFLALSGRLLLSRTPLGLAGCRPRQSNRRCASWS